MIIDKEIIIFMTYFIMYSWLTNLNTLQGTLLRIQKISKIRWGIEGSIDGRFSNMVVNVWHVIGDRTFSFLAQLWSKDVHDIEKIAVREITNLLRLNLCILFVIIFTKYDVYNNQLTLSGKAKYVSKQANKMNRAVMK